MAYLVDDVDAVVELLPLQDGVQVVQPILQVLFSVAKGDDDGDFLQRLTVLGSEASAVLHIGIVLLYLLQIHRGVELHPERTHWGRPTRETVQVNQSLVIGSYSATRVQKVQCPEPKIRPTVIWVTSE